MGHYSDPVPAIPSARRRVELVLPDVTVEMETDRGVFSFGRIDPGTKLLLQEAPPPPPHGPLLDLGCGYGAIAVTLARRAPQAAVWAVDVNERARELTKRNAERVGVGNVTVASPDEVPRVLAFEALYSNPPIKVGKSALHELLDLWVGRTAVSYLVVHKHLGSDSLVRWMEAERGWAVERLVSRAGYRVLQVLGR